MDDVVDVGVVADIDADRAAFAQAQQRAGYRAVVAKGVDHPPGASSSRSGAIRSE